MSSPKNYDSILEAFLKDALIKTSVDDLQPGSMVNTLLEQVERTERYVALSKFLLKLDPRFKQAIDPWIELRVVQRYYSRP